MQMDGASWLEALGSSWVNLGCQKTHLQTVNDPVLLFRIPFFLLLLVLPLIIFLLSASR